jgi:hypothetical protein
MVIGRMICEQSTYGNTGIVHSYHFIGSYRLEMLNAIHSKYNLFLACILGHFIGVGIAEAPT